MRKISSFVIVVSLILTATGFGVWAASRTTNQANVTVKDTREGIRYPHIRHAAGLLVALAPGTPLDTRTLEESAVTE